ncbi:uncharacterized protein CTHT_0072670 [Thermochaetoides thermophila DSM 1495]|uniref:Ecp2 effector protein domain-containing protein n=1 Tax=Chaetomium thermophilum (strain DSM 1495 / CBS 144.50 / IMI 039719) TaxID=759272 RepID=G0SFZ2_CHATD|nr:hypothetical protein CTHT_0072670 [Thermochaetoides thermophila DSM 1495]EGS17907.1 hypothetical protein CTHT_0072670 [Thermochaetoides thermophila DSM 1495]
MKLLLFSLILSRFLLSHALPLLQISPRTTYPLNSFSGLGQLRTLSTDRVAGNPDIGCLTSAGAWTTDERKCGVFRAVRSDVHHITIESIPVLTSIEGSGTGVNLGGICGIEVGVFKCGGGVKQAVFGTWGLEGPIPGREQLRYGQYGVVATDGISPPQAWEEPLQIHFYSGKEKGQWAWLGWKELGVN